MEAKDIMTAPVITVAPDSTLHEVVEILLQHRISGVPVVDGGQVVGVVGDGDLLHRYEIGTEGWGQRGWWQRLTQPGADPAAYVRSHGGHVRDVMCHEVVCVTEATPLAQLASLFDKRHIRRAPVLRDGALVGLVTRADLVRALAMSTAPGRPKQACAVAGGEGAPVSAAPGRPKQACAAGEGDGAPVTTVAAPALPARTDDEAIRERLTEELGRQSWWSGTWSGVLVQDGVVRYVGVVQSEFDKQAARVAAENTPGVRRVEDKRMLQAEWQPMF